MAIAGTKSARTIGGRGAAGAPVTARALALVPLDAPRQDPPAQRHVETARFAFSGFDSQLNDRISGAQQALQFLDRLGAQLQALRSGISQHLVRTQGGLTAAATMAVDSSAIDAQIQQVNACWLERQSVTAGTLNCRLEYGAPGEARQNFAVRGLDFDSLRANRSFEILHFAIGDKGHRAGSSVAIESGLSNAAFVNRFDRALAPSGVRAAQSAHGALTFSVLEPAWSTVRDTFSIMGEGHRFSTGRFNRVRVVPEAPVLQPQEWSSAGIAGLRSTRQEVFKAQGAVRQARQIVARGLTDAGAHLEAEIAATGARAAAEALWCAEFTETFVEAASRPDYLALASFGPALMGISRQRVITVLGRPPTETPQSAA